MRCKGNADWRRWFRWGEMSSICGQIEKWSVVSGLVFCVNRMERFVPVWRAPFLFQRSLQHLADQALIGNATGCGFGLDGGQQRFGQAHVDPGGFGGGIG